MILSDNDIKKSLETGRIVITPAPNLATQLGPCSVDFHLGTTINVFDYTKLAYLDPHDKASLVHLTREIHLEDGKLFYIHPGEMIIAATKEWLEVDNTLIGRLEGRSSLARMGIVVHSTAARFDPGWKGCPVLELGNLSRIPVALYPGMRICAFTFEQLSSPASVEYHKKSDAKYANHTGPVMSKISQEF